MVTTETSEARHTITLRPNRSATWQETRIIILFLCATTLSVGVFWTFVGAWVVLPFSILEACLIAWLLYRVSLSTYQRQVITIDEKNVSVQTGIYYPKKTWTLDRWGTSIAVRQPAHHLDGPGLSLFDSCHHIKVGQFLNPNDSRKALAALKTAGLFVRHPVK